MTDGFEVGRADRERALPRRSINATVGLTDNHAAQRAALDAASVCELETGLTVEQIDAIHAEQRARVRARYGQQP